MAEVVYPYRNHYQCDECVLEWIDEWYCAVDVECPTCGSDYTPLKTEDIPGFDKACEEELKRRGGRLQEIEGQWYWWKKNMQSSEAHDTKHEALLQAADHLQL